MVGFDNAPRGQRRIQKDGVHNAVDYAASAVGNQSGIFSQQIECSDRWRGRERVEAIMCLLFSPSVLVDHIAP